MTDIKRGDRVRITFEGEADEHLAGIAYGTHDADYRDFEVCSTEGDTVTIEKIEPPVEVFKPGDVVRSVHKFPVGNVYAITEDGFVRIKGKGWAAAQNGVHVHFPIGEFTSEHYEKVAIE